METTHLHAKCQTKLNMSRFYCGNEANVELYVNATGLMWEHAEKAGAVLVFAEHRYYGETAIYPGPANHT